MIRPALQTVGRRFGSSRARRSIVAPKPLECRDQKRPTHDEEEASEAEPEEQVIESRRNDGAEPPLYRPPTHARYAFQSGSAALRSSFIGPNRACASSDRVARAVDDPTRVARFRTVRLGATRTGRPRQRPRARQASARGGSLVAARPPPPPAKATYVACSTNRRSAARAFGIWRNDAGRSGRQARKPATNHADTRRSRRPHRRP